MNYQKGFVVPLLLALIALVLIGGGTYVYTKYKNTVQTSACAEKYLNEVSQHGQNTFQAGILIVEFNHPGGYTINDPQYILKKDEEVRIIKSYNLNVLNRYDTLPMLSVTVPNGKEIEIACILRKNQTVGNVYLNFASFTTTSIEARLEI